MRFAKVVRGGLIMLGAATLLTLWLQPGAIAQTGTFDLDTFDLDSLPQDDMQALPQEEPQARRVENPVAEFTGIDKITGRIITFDVYIDETVQFGALQVTPRVCYSSPETEEPRTDSFVEVDEITLDRNIERIFSGWMFAESPGVNAVEHAVYDVWLKNCKQESDVPPPDTAGGD